MIMRTLGTDPTSRAVCPTWPPGAVAKDDSSELNWNSPGPWRSVLPSVVWTSHCPESVITHCGPGAWCQSPNPSCRKHRKDDAFDIFRDDAHHIRGSRGCE